MEENVDANNVARAISTALDWSSSPEDRKAAVSYLDSVKSGDIRNLANLSFVLVRKEWSSEIRLHAFKMLQHLVRLHWEELTSFERSNFAGASINLISDIASVHEEWALKSQTAALLAEVVRREGLNLWKELLPSLVSLSSKGPVEAELVAMMLRWLPEDITVHNEDLEGDRRRMLLRGLTQSLPEVFPLLYGLLEKHFGATITESGKEQFAVAKQHAATVTAVLNAVNAYAEWAPISDLAKYGLVHGCGFLLSSIEFRLHAGEFFKLVSLRKRPMDAYSEFDTALRNIFQILMNISRDFLNRTTSKVETVVESEFEFAECICESMVSLGTSNLQCIAGDSVILPLYLQQMLGYFQHHKLGIHFQSLLFWLGLMRESMPKAKATTQSSIVSSGSSEELCPVDKDKRVILSLIKDDICREILNVSFQRMIKKTTPCSSLSSGALELWSDEFDGKGDFSQYRSKLLELIRLISCHKPITAALEVSQRIDSVIHRSMHSPVASQDLSTMESTQMILDAIISVIFDGSTEIFSINSEVRFTLHRILEGLLQQFLSLKWVEPPLVEILGRYLDSMGPFLKHYPDTVGGTIDKLFELLTSLPLKAKDSLAVTARHARLQICASFIRIAKAADKSLLPHMKGIASTMGYLQQQGHLSRGEHNLLGEAFLIMASAAGIQQQQEVLAWLLEPMSHQWIQMEWQNVYLSNPLSFVHLCSETSLMWSIFHTVTFFERALKRSGARRGKLNSQSSEMEGESSIHPHPMASHLSWMLPPLLRLIRCLHSLWSSSILQVLPGDLRAAMSMSPAEQASFLGEVNPKITKGALNFSDGSHIDVSKEGFGEPNENDRRNWLKSIRDSGYNVIGLSTTIEHTFFKCLDSSSVSISLLENIQTMEFRHIRQLIHSVLIPLVKSCPRDAWEQWLEKLLQPLFLHCQQSLSYSWSCLLREGRAKVPDLCGNLTSLGLKVEVMEEKLLRDLTREICSLLSVLASPALNNELVSVSLEQSAYGNRMEVSSLKDLDSFASSTLMGFLIKHKGPAGPALQITLEAFSWIDGEAVGKLTNFCGTVIHLAALINHGELREFVAKDLFYSIIQGLSLESNAIISADLIGLCRDIFVYLSDRDPAPRQVLLSLPCISKDDLLAFEESLSKTTSPKEQKQHMKSLLLLATGNKLKAIVVQKTTNVITNVSNRTRSSEPPREEDSIGLASINA